MAREQGYYTDDDKGHPIFFSNRDFNIDTKDVFIPMHKRLSAIRTVSGYRLSRKHEKMLRQISGKTAVYLLINLEDMSVKEQAKWFFEIRLFDKIRKSIRSVY